MEKEIWYHKLNTYFVIFYLLFSFCLMGFYLFNGQLYYAALGLGGILLLLLPTVFERAYNLSPVYQFHFLAYCFLFFSYVIGLVMQAYHFIPLYDKIMHTLSGTLGMFLGVLLFYLCKDKQEFQKQDYPLVAITSFSVSMAIAGLWEIGEYLISLFFPCDPQRVAETGVSDTMQDFIVCMIGALLWLPFLYRFYRKDKADFLMNCLLIFFKKNAKHSHMYNQSRL